MHNPFPNRPYPEAGISARLEPKFIVYRSLLLVGALDIAVRRQEIAWYAGAEAMFDIMAFELTELPEDDAADEMSKLKNALWLKAQQFKK